MPQALALLPESTMGFVGLARDEETFAPRAYLESLPVDLSGQPVIVLDPMLATGGSLEHCVRLIVERGCTDVTVICVLAAPEGIARLERAGLPMRLVTAAIDDKGTIFNQDVLGALELEYMVKTAETIVMGAIERKESRGAQSRADFPERDDENYLKHFTFTEGDAGPVLGEAPITFTQWEPEVRSY